MDEKIKKKNEEKARQIEDMADGLGIKRSKPVLCMDEHELGWLIAEINKRLEPKKKLVIKGWEDVAWVVAIVVFATGIITLLMKMVEAFKK